MPISRRRALRYRLSADCARLRPGTTAELASLVLQMSDEIDTRERMLDAALRPAPTWPAAILGLALDLASRRPRRAASPGPGGPPGPGTRPPEQAGGRLALTACLSH